MDTINDIMHSIARYPLILGDYILEEGNQINKSIKDNITKLNLIPVEYYEYIPEITNITFITTLFLSIITCFTFIYKNTKTSNTINNKTTNKTNTAVIRHQTNKPNIKKFGLYLESVKEVNDASKKIIASFEKGQTYWVLVRVQMLKHINMAGTKFELHGNNIHPETTDTKSAFQTKDAYLIFKFKIMNDISPNTLIGNVIVRYMNDLNTGAFPTNDFIICGIGTCRDIGVHEFINGLKHIDYELENNICANKYISRTNMIITYGILLPIHQIYDVFMDVYNNCLFESTKYVIDNDNYESWNGKSINELAF